MCSLNVGELLTELVALSYFYLMHNSALLSHGKGTCQDDIRDWTPEDEKEINLFISHG